ncbi:RNase adapter RapZ [Humidisolicoccus flavus]|uniref:RNase adapter RapZ n=1 Tax=Humidisolicoccus flavus TaxID=3111414 RepID=UPI00324A98E0
MSGAGRSTVANALEDLGFYVVDNLPPTMLRALVELVRSSADEFPKLAIVVDVRGGVLFDDAMALIQELRDGFPVQVVFLEATDQTLVRRFEQVRRPHPLQDTGTLIDGITTERARLQGIRGLADLLIDTSDLNIHQLSTRVAEQFSHGGHPGVTLTVMSFGFKYGLPVDADHVADMRFLPNPFWQPELRQLTGQDKAVSDYVFAQEGAESFIEHYHRALTPVLEGYQRENKHHAVFAIGCTGGKHRSVAIATKLAEQFSELPGVVVNLKHRDLGRE